MKHQIKKGRKFNRDYGERKALLKSLASSLIEHGVIETTIYKAKDTRQVVDKLMKFALRGNLSDRRILISRLGSQVYASKLIQEIAPRFKDRVSGFTSVQRSSKRAGDNAQMAFIKWVTPLKEKAVEEPNAKKEKVVKKETVAKKVKTVSKTQRVPKSEAI